MVDHRGDASPGRTEGQAGEKSERIAKALARAGVASRREVERIIADGRVAVNGTTLTTPAVKVSASDRITIDGRAVAAAEPTRLFRFHKPPGLVTTHHDPKGRPTVFDALPQGLPRLISVGRLDLNSEGLLLLTNDGELARRLELPSNGFVRRYRARVRGQVEPGRLDRLQNGVTVDGVRYGPIDAHALPNRPGAANQWVFLSFAEGKNREARRVLEAIGLSVNRLIRVAYGPFELGELARGAIEEIALPARLEPAGPDRAEASKTKAPKSGKSTRQARPPGKGRKRFARPGPLP